MRARLCLKLSICCEQVPLVAVEDGDVGVQGLADERASTYRSIASIQVSVLAMTFIKDTSPN